MGRRAGDRRLLGLGGLLFRLAAFGTAEFFARQLFVKGLAAVDADLSALIFSAHAPDCGEPSHRLAKVISVWAARSTSLPGLPPPRASVASPVVPSLIAIPA